MPRRHGPGTPRAGARRRPADLCFGVSSDMVTRGAPLPSGESCSGRGAPRGCQPMLRGMESAGAISGLPECWWSWTARFTGLLVMSWSPWSCDQRQVGAARRPRVPGERPQTPTSLPRRAGGPRDLHVFGGVFRRGGAPAWRAVCGRRERAGAWGGAGGSVRAVRSAGSGAAAASASRHALLAVRHLRGAHLRTCSGGRSRPPSFPKRRPGS
jgi:hypothetical protein